MSERRPYRVRIRLGSPVALTHPWVHFDSLLSDLALARRLGRRVYDLPAWTPVDHRALDYALGPDPYADAVYTRCGLPFASVSEFRPQPKLGSTSYYKRVDDSLPKARVRHGIGPYRAWQMRLVYVAAEEVEFHAWGRPDLAADLLEDLVGLGSETRAGWGHVLGVVVEEEDEDWSLVRDGRATRPIPVRLLVSSSDAVPLAWRPPYWHGTYVELCAPPGAEVDFGGSPRTVLRQLWAQSPRSPSLASWEIRNA